MEASAFLKEVPLFADALDDDQLRFLAAQSRPAFFLAGTRLMSQGDFGGAMFVIVSGEVAVTFADADAREQSVAKLGPHDVVGEMSLFTGDRRTATVSAATNVDAIEITKSSLERVFAKAPELVDTFARVLAKRQAELSAVKKQRGEEAGDNFRHQARKAFRRLFRRQS
jgi:CRP-like cAMP-binding protein